MCKALEKIEEERDWLSFLDIMLLLDCGEGVARRTIREIRNYNGFCPLPRGKVLITEYERWLNKDLKK